MLGVSVHGFAKSAKATARIDSFFGATAGGGPSTAETGVGGKGITFAAPRTAPASVPFFRRSGPSDSSASGGGGGGGGDGGGGGSAGRRGETAACRGGGLRLSGEAVLVEAGAGRKRLRIDMTGEGGARTEDAGVNTNSGGDGGGGAGAGAAAGGVGNGGDVGVKVGVGSAEDAKREGSMPKGGVDVISAAAGSPQKRHRRPSADDNDDDDDDDEEGLCWPSVPPSTATPSATLPSAASATTSPADRGANPTAVSFVFDAHDQSRMAGRRDDAIANTSRKEAPVLPPSPRPAGVTPSLSAGGGSGGGNAASRPAICNHR